MAESATHHEPDRQLPLGDEIFLDHVGHFVSDAEAAGRALARAGFAPTPVSIQYNPDGSPVGTGNITAMLRRGYIEVLFKAADTPLGREFEAMLAGNAGPWAGAPHMVQTSFSTGTPTSEPYSVHDPS